MGVTGILQKRVESAPLLPHVPKTEISGAPVYVRSNPERWRPGSSGLQVKAACFFKSRKIQPVSLDKRTVSAIGLSGTSAEIDLFCTGINQLEGFDRDVGESAPYGNFQGPGLVTHLVDTDPGFRVIPFLITKKQGQEA
jgi:hypothetical protein